jgi:CHAD domain-containing protein
MTTEREVKLAPAPGFRLPDLSGVAEGVSAVTAETLRLQATYFDTSDLRLARSGASLRYRNDEGWLVKLPAPGDGNGSLLSRDEHRFDGAPGTPPASALDLVLGLVRTAPVEPVSNIRTLRRRVELHDAEGEALAEVVDDEVSVLDGGRVAARFRELEVELREHAGSDLAGAVVGRLRDAGAAEEEAPTPKVVRALGPRALDPPDVRPPPRLAKTGPAGDVLRAAVAASVARLVAHDPVVRLGEDPEGVHQARVATRRLRSDLRTFRELLDTGWNDSLRDELKWLATALGAVRDADVLLARLQAKVDRLPEADREPATGMLRRLDRDRDEKRGALLEVIRSRRYLELLDRLVNAAHQPMLLDEADAPHSGDVAPQLVRKPWERVTSAVDELGDEPSDEALHEVRKRAKRARYAAEAVTPVAGKPAQRLAEALEDVQDVLGEHQDAVVAERWLRDALPAASPRETFVIGQLCAMERLDAESSRAAWGDTWKTARKRRLRAWL